MVELRTSRAVFKPAMLTIVLPGAIPAVLAAIEWYETKGSISTGQADALPAIRFLAALSVGALFYWIMVMNNAVMAIRNAVVVEQDMLFARRLFGLSHLEVTRSEVVNVGANEPEWRNHPEFGRGAYYPSIIISHRQGGKTKEYWVHIPLLARQKGQLYAFLEAVERLGFPVDHRWRNLEP